MELLKEFFFFRKDLYTHIFLLHVKIPTNQTGKEGAEMFMLQPRK